MQGLRNIYLYAKLLPKGLHMNEEEIYMIRNNFGRTTLAFPLKPGRGAGRESEKNTVGSLPSQTRKTLSGVKMESHGAEWHAVYMLFIYVSAKPQR